jgi:hypothetical protein
VYFSIMGILAKPVAALKRGRAIQVEVTNALLAPKVKQGAVLTFKPVTDATVLKPGDVVLCNADDRERILLVKSISVGRVKLGTATKVLEGWASRASIYGVSDGDG